VTVIEFSRAHICVSEPFDLSVQLSYDSGEAQQYCQPNYQQLIRLGNLRR
jgi:hypothetical protein